MAALSDTKIRSAKPRITQYKLYDERGLYMIVKPTGAKYWRFKYAFGGKEQSLAFGVYPDVPLALARQRRDDARKMVAAGKNPQQVKKDEKRKQIMAAGNSFEAVAREWHTKQSTRWVKKHAEAVWASLERDVLPAIGYKPIHEVTVRDMLDALQPIEERGALDVVRRVNQRCGEIFTYAILTERCENNPTIGLSKTFQARGTKHRAALGEKDMPTFLKALESYAEVGSKVVQLALKFLILTFVRPGELRGALWSEIDFKKAEWRIGAERMKMGKEHIVPLSKQAIAILEQLKIVTQQPEDLPEGALLFSSVKSTLKPISDVTLLKAIHILGFKEKCVPHGFRATASTILNENGFGADVIERQLAHTEQNKVRAAYHRAEYLDDRRKMMQWWADKVDALRNNKKQN